MKILKLISLFVLIAAQSSCSSDPLDKDNSEKIRRKQGGIESSGDNNQSKISKKIDSEGADDSEILEAPEFVDTGKESTSTFSVDVDTASYAMLRSTINNGNLPDRQFIRLEEWINYFDYDYPAPDEPHPISAHTERSISPWDDTQQILRIGIQAQKLAEEDLPPANLVFLVDVSGSMQDTLKLPLVQSTLKLLTPKLRTDDRIAIVTYAGTATTVLEATPGDHRDAIESAIDDLSAGGGTNGAGGIKAAYKIAAENFIEGGLNRVVLATDGDFNVGVTNETELVKLIKSMADNQIFLTALGFDVYGGDKRLETIADQGNGQYAYIDSESEAKSVMVDNLMGTLMVVAKDIKVQIVFDQTQVKQYRLLGYDNRRLETEDFVNDAKDAGDIGVGHNVTALYEVVMTEDHDPLIPPAQIKIRYKKPDSFESVDFSTPVALETPAFLDSTDDHRFSIAVANLARSLLNEKEKTVSNSTEWGQSALGVDLRGKRTEFMGLIEKIESLRSNGIENLQ